MDDSSNHTFINFNASNPRPTSTQRQAVSTYIGRYYRNRSAPSQRLRGLSSRTHEGQNTRSHGLDGQITAAEYAERYRDVSLSSADGPGDFQFESDSLPLLRPVIEHTVPAYPMEHREKVFNVLDFHIHFLAARLQEWGKGPTPFMRCWVQMVCSDVTLFDSVATFTHGVRLTTLEGQTTPSAAMLWHKVRALKGLQAKISTEDEDKETIWTASETILATFYLMEGAARFGYESEFKTHCLGLLRMMRLRGDVASGCLKDLYVMQAVGLVEGTEMASELRHHTDDQHRQRPPNHQLTCDPTTVHPTQSVLQYIHPGFQINDPLRDAVDASPVGFRNLFISGDVSVEFIQILDDLREILAREKSQQVESITEATEQQIKAIKRMRLFADRSDKASERLACIGVVAFLTRRTSQIQMFPEKAFLDRLTELGRNISLSTRAETADYHELRVWVTLVGAEIASTAGATLKQHVHDAMTELIFQETWIDGWEDIERISRKYIWDETSLAAWKVYWMGPREIGRDSRIAGRHSNVTS